MLKSTGTSQKIYVFNYVSVYLENARSTSTSTLTFTIATGKVIYPKCYINSKYFSADWDGVFCYTENLFSFAKASYFCKCFFQILIGKISTKSRVSVHCIVCRVYNRDTVPEIIDSGPMLGDVILLLPRYTDSRTTDTQ